MPFVSSCTKASERRRALLIRQAAERRGESMQFSTVGRKTCSHELQGAAKGGLLEAGCEFRSSINSGLCLFWGFFWETKLPSLFLLQSNKQQSLAYQSLRWSACPHSTSILNTCSLVWIRTRSLCFSAKRWRWAATRTGSDSRVAGGTLTFAVATTEDIVIVKV